MHQYIKSNAKEKKTQRNNHLAFSLLDILLQIDLHCSHSFTFLIQGIAKFLSIYSLKLLQFPDVPDSPTHLQATEVTKTSVTLTWEVPQKDGGSPITGYIVERCQQPGSRWVKVSKKSTPDTMYAVNELIEHTDYKFRVAAENSVGIGKPSEPTSSITVKIPYGKS